MARRRLPPSGGTQSASSRPTAGTRVSSETPGTRTRRAHPPNAVPFGARRLESHRQLFGAVVRRAGNRSTSGWKRAGAVGILRVFCWRTRGALRGPWVRGRGAPFGAHPSQRDRSQSPFAGEIGRPPRVQPSGWMRGVPVSQDLRVPGRVGSARSQTRPRLCLPRHSWVERTPSRSWSRRVKGWTTAQRPVRGRHPNVTIQSPWEHRAARSGNAATLQRTPRWNKALRPSTRARRCRGDTETAGRGATARGNTTR